ncbi:aspartyl/glutamyl-tRNA(Asn/Gln) amidotransferase subunit A [Desulforamulus reducens MI-1]|uniref:Glutamyl-tRNA(Gln) amidotransferase subunit A n=1 Tax=Desulforamulus reducens (strain ATCC BAA-1160 / DSM 100696 / MI-1) TaxID=349161 RepID=GATA_DESRM|nr:Asp-tRNA(Asn)/Glu-tRNA(Gln) amidotransferase subunit GatA [Desulforamulus reducens]A4J6Z8.1 RecName: Full=Glutamyl-tRNA(Gln) amidotransferase subunit A; Short=Glu-ADT subunit A [Desulforamulus reducens MI-1]ABO50851.1 aspartyl/glutamyl-tRNA(Asn/Gln) amidotransferase subunit A [Desulforamulus reducens MI-1]
MDLFQLTAHQLHQLLTKKEISALDITEAVYNRIEQVEDKVKSYLTLTREQAEIKARQVDQKIAAGESIGPLAGIPIAIKDNMCTQGIRTTCASKILYNFVPPYSATSVEKVYTADMVMVGKTNMDEFAMGSSTENSGFHLTHNPWDLDRVPGGSSGGSAAAVAAGEAIISLGSDTGGSIRQPAALCGVVGMKPTYGSVSRYGLVAYASSLDQIGPFTRDVTDMAHVLNVICGHDPMDSTSANLKQTDYTQFLTNDIKGMKIGVPREYMADGIDPQVREKIKAAIQKLTELGAHVEETSMPHTDYAMPAYYLIATAEASSNLARYDGVRYGLRVEEARDLVDMFMRSRSQGFGDEVKRRIMLGTYSLSAGYYDAYYLKALKVRTLIKQDFDRAFEKYDALLSPTSPTTAFKIGEMVNDPIQMYLQDVCTIPVNLAGIPAISLPCGLANNLPVGLQLMGKAFDEGTLLRIAYTLEQNTEYTRLRPEI